MLDILFVVPVADHEMVVFLGNDAVGHAFYHHFFIVGNAYDAFFRVGKKYLLIICNVLILVFGTDLVERMPRAHVRPPKIAFDHVNVI